MSDLLHLVISFPTVIFTIPLGVILIYWATVFVGLLDLDILDVTAGADGGVDGAAEGAAHAAAEGAAHAAAEGAAHAAAEGAAEGVGHAAADGMADAATEGASEGAAEGVGHAHEGIGHGVMGGLAGIMGFLRVGRVPLTITLSILVIMAWATSLLSSATLHPNFFLPFWLLAISTVAFSLLVGTVVASFVVRPMEGLFVTHLARSRREVIGTTCHLATGRVDERFGQANLEDGGAGLLIQVRCDRPNTLKRDDEVLIVAYDEAREAFVIEPLSH